ncbi:MAG: MFS transporter [Dermatophilaceae bacterium]
MGPSRTTSLAMSPTTTAASRPPSGGIWRRPGFGWLVLAEGLASVASQAVFVALTLLVLERWGAGASLGAVLAAAAVPQALLLPLGGVTSDRWGPARVVAVTSAVHAVVLGALAALVVYGEPSLPVLAVIAAAGGLADAFHQPAALSLPPAVVDRAALPRANAVLHGTEAVADVVVPAAVATTVAAVGIRPSFVVIAAAAGLSTVATWLLTRSLRRAGVTGRAADPGAASESVRSALRAGLSVARRTPMVAYAIVVLTVLNVFVVAPVVVGGAALSTEALGSSTGFGWLLSAFGVGSVGGLLAAAWFRMPRRPALVTAVLVASIGALLAVMGLVAAATAVVLAAVGIGAAGGYLGVMVVTWLQGSVPAALLGRVMSLVAVATVALDPLGLALAGLLLGASTQVLFVSCAVVVTACGVVGIVATPVRRLS